jgi:hypothetical protein
MSVDRETKSIIDTEELFVNIKATDLWHEIVKKILNGNYNMSEDAKQRLGKLNFSEIDTIEDYKNYNLLKEPEDTVKQDNLSDKTRIIQEIEVTPEIKKLESYAEKIQNENKSVDNTVLLPKLIKLYYPMEQIVKDIEVFTYMYMKCNRFIKHYYDYFIEQIIILGKKLSSEKFKEENERFINNESYQKGIDHINKIPTVLTEEWAINISELIGEISLGKIKDLVHYIIHKSNTTNNINMNSEYVSGFPNYDNRHYKRLAALYDGLFDQMSVLYEIKDSLFWNKTAHDLNIKHFYPVYVAASYLYKSILFQGGFDLNTLKMHKINPYLVEKLRDMELKSENQLVNLFLNDYRKYPFKIITSRNMLDTICALQHREGRRGNEDPYRTYDTFNLICKAGDIELSYFIPQKNIIVSSNLLFLENKPLDNK